jgi:hypothetical protein
LVVGIIAAKQGNPGSSIKKHCHHQSSPKEDR